MHAPLSTPDGLPARAAIIIIGCLIVFSAALWLFIVTKTMIAIGLPVRVLTLTGEGNMNFKVVRHEHIRIFLW